MTPGVIVCDIY